MPPREADGPEEPEDDPRGELDPEPHGCQPFGAEPAREGEEAPPLLSDPMSGIIGPGT